jgi:hypothetical protein
MNPMRANDHEGQEANESVPKLPWFYTQILSQKAGLASPTLLINGEQLPN